jgi:hypothetical protein
LGVHNDRKYKSFYDIKKPLSDSIFVNGEESGYSTPESKKGDNPCMQSMLLGSRQEREQERQLMKRSSLVEIGGSRNFHFNEDVVITESDGEDSPMFGSIGRTKTDEK